jgi:hypothetical protein
MNVPVIGSTSASSADGSVLPVMFFDSCLSLPLHPHMSSAAAIIEEMMVFFISVF